MTLETGADIQKRNGFKVWDQADDFVILKEPEPCSDCGVPTLLCSLSFMAVQCEPCNKILWRKFFRANTPKFAVRLEFKPQDLWIGVFWKRTEDYRQDLWFCLIPCVPIHFVWRVK